MIGMLTALVRNALSTSAPVAASEFMPKFWKREAEQEQTPEETLRIFQAMAGG
jgi:hypothetical protein